MMRLFFNVTFFVALSFLTISCSKKNNTDSYSSETLKIVPITENSWIHTSYLQTESFGKVACNGLIVRSGNQSLIFDTPTTDSVSSELIHWVESTLAIEIHAIIPTHFHDDCLGGLNAFHEHNIPSFASSRTIALATENSLTVPKTAFTDFMRIRLNDDDIHIVFLGEGHSLDNVVGYFTKDKVLFGGCLVKSKGASKGFLGDANVAEWSNTVAKIKTRFPDLEYVVPGHGSFGGVELLDYTIELFKQQLK